MQPIDVVTAIIQAVTLALLVREFPLKRRTALSGATAKDADADNVRMDTEHRRNELYRQAIEGLMERDTKIIQLNADVASLNVRVLGLENERAEREKRIALLETQLNEYKLKLEQSERLRDQERVEHLQTVALLNERLSQLQAELDQFSKTHPATITSQETPLL